MPKVDIKHTSNTEEGISKIASKKQMMWVYPPEDVMEQNVFLMNSYHP